MAGNPYARAALERFAPRTHVSLQNLVMAMADVVNNTGKKSFLGKDKGIVAMENFGRSFRAVVISMRLDGQLLPEMSSEESVAKLESVMKLFRDGYPNWQEAYLYFEWLTTENRQRFIQMMASA